jgi:hypothetical protein
MTLFKNQIEAARDVRESFKHISYVILLAQMQSGKTGTFKLVGAEMLREGIIDRVVIFSGSRELELKRQTEDHRKFGVSYRKYLRNNLGMNSDEVEDIVEEIIRNIEVVWGQNLKKFVPRNKKTLYIWDESHYGQTQEQEVDKFLTRIGIQATGVVPEGSYVLSVSATPMSELCDKSNFEQMKKVVYMKPDDTYIGVEQLLNNGQIISIREDQIIQTLDTIHFENYGIIRAYEKKQSSILEVASLRNWSVVHHDMDSDIDLNVILATPPTNPTIILIKGKMRMGKQLQKKNVSFCMETSEPKTDTFLQGLTGRCCGYKHGEDWANVSIKIYVVNVDVEEIRRYIKMLDDFVTVPFKANNVVAQTRQKHYYISPIIFKMNEHFNGATVKDERDDLAQVAWKLIDELEDNPQTVELKQRDRTKFVVRSSFTSKKAEPTDELFSRLRHAALYKQPFHPRSIYGCDIHFNYSIYIWCLNESAREYAVVASTVNPPCEIQNITPDTTRLEVFCKINDHTEKDDGSAAETELKHTGYLHEDSKDDADILEQCIKEAVEVSRTKRNFVTYPNKITSSKSILLSPIVFEALNTTIRGRFKNDGVLLNYEKMRGRNPTNNEFIRLKEISWEFIEPKSVEPLIVDDEDNEYVNAWLKMREAKKEAIRFKKSISEISQHLGESIGKSIICQ